MENTEATCKGYQLDDIISELDYVHCMIVTWGSRAKSDLEIAACAYNDDRDDMLREICDILDNYSTLRHYDEDELADESGWEKEFGPEPPEHGLWGFNLEGDYEVKWFTDEPTYEEIVKLYTSMHADASSDEIETEDAECLVEWIVGLLDFKTKNGENLLDTCELVYPVVT